MLGEWLWEKFASFTCEEKSGGKALVLTCLNTTYGDADKYIQMTVAFC